MLVIFVLRNIQEGERSVVLLGVIFVAHSIFILMTPTACYRGVAVGACYCFSLSVGTGYAAGIKQSREPMYVFAVEAAEYECAYESPACAP